MKAYRFACIILALIPISMPLSAAESPGYQQYRRSVLGDLSSGSPLVTTAAPSLLLVPGPYAQYLMVNGAGEDEAVAKAALLGEAAHVRWPAAMPHHVPRDALAAHEKSLGSSDYPTRSLERGAE